MMKSLATPSFFHVFDLLLGVTNPGLKLSSWTQEKLTWQRERHSYTGPKHGLSIEIVTITHPGRYGWSVMIVKEYWWVGSESRAVKSARWAKAISGRRNDIMSWFRTQESLLNRHFAAGRAEVPARADATEQVEFVVEGNDE